MSNNQPKQPVQYPILTEIQYPPQPSNEFIAKSVAKYYPEEANFWMYAMIVLGLSFIIFVAITIYKLCLPENDPRNKQLSQHPQQKQTGTTTSGGPNTIVD